MSSQSATNRVKDLKAKLLSKQQKQDIAIESALSVGTKSDDPSSAIKNQSVNFKSVSGMTSEIISSVPPPSMNREQLTNLGIALKLDIGEDRALASLVKSVMLFVFDGSIGLDDVQKALDIYVAKELDLVTLEAHALTTAVGTMLTVRSDLDHSNRELSTRFPEFRRIVSEASTNKRRRLEYNTKAAEILAVGSKERAQNRLEQISEVLDALRQSNRKLARTIEYRKHQIEPLVYWAKVLETGRF